MREDANELSGAPPQEQAELVGRIMKRQAGLSLRVGLVFVVLLIGLPLVNLYNPTLMSTPVGGFTLSWLILGVLIFPVTWFLSGYFVKQSDAVEAEIVREAKKPAPAPAATEPAP